MFSTKLQSLVELIAVARLVENAKVLSQLLSLFVIYNIFLSLSRIPPSVCNLRTPALCTLVLRLCLSLLLSVFSLPLCFNPLFFVFTLAVFQLSHFRFSMLCLMLLLALNPLQRSVPLERFLRADGLPVLELGMPRLRVTKALYGTIEDPRSCKDVTQVCI